MPLTPTDPQPLGSKVNLELSAGPPQRNVTQSLFIRVSDWLLFKHEAEQLFDVAEEIITPMKCAKNNELQRLTTII